MNTDNSLTLDLDDELLGSAKDALGDIHCVFSSTDVAKVGTGTTTRKHVSKLFWFVEQIGEDDFHVKKINIHNVPTGDPIKVNLEQLMERYVPEVEFYEDKVLPAMESLEDHLDEGEAEYANGKLYSAEGHFDKAIGMDAENVRALFNLGMIYIDLKDLDKARDMMDSLLKIKTVFEGKNQHLFNEFGISLRKARMFDEAAAHYQHALEYIKSDEHLFYNLARVNYERSNWEDCVDALEEVFSLNPKLKLGHDLVAIVLNLSQNPALAARHGKKEVPMDMVERLRTLQSMSDDNTKVEEIEDILSIESGEDLGIGRVRSGKQSPMVLDFDID